MTVRIGDSMRRRQGAPARPPRPRAFPWARWLAIAAIAAIVSFGTGYAMAVFVLFPAPEQPAGGVAVPDFVGRDVRDAERELLELGLELGDVDDVPHPTIPVGIIVAQSPVAGQQLRAGARIDVGVSAGPVRVTVPDVTGFRAARASALAARLGFEVEAVEEESPLPAGQVLRVEPAPGTTLELPAAIRLITSTGPPPEPDEETLGIPADTLGESPPASPVQNGMVRPPE